jgi:hypothetical protein
MTENLLTPSVIKLFGRLVNDLSFNYDPNTVVQGYDNLLQRQLANGPLPITGTTTALPAPPPPPAPQNSNIVSGVSPMSGLYSGMNVTATATSGGVQVFARGTAITTIGPGNSFVVSPPPLLAVVDIAIFASWTPNLARIYGFTYEGAYYALPRPAIFLVHGSGQQVGNWGYPSTVEQSGVAAREWDFSGPTNYNCNGLGFPPFPPQTPNELWYWEYEKGDFSIRFDTEAGPFEQILLMATLRAGADRADRSGMSLSGMSVSGMSVSGMSLSGMSLGANPNSPRNGR